MNNRKIIIAKRIFILGYPIIVFLLWQIFATPEVFNNISLANFLSVAMHSILLFVAVTFWIGLTYILISCYFSKWMIKRRLKQAEKALGNLATATLISYKPNVKGNYITMRWRSCGIPVETWTDKKKSIQASINYTIIGEIENDGSDLSIVVFNAKKGRQYPKKEVLYEKDSESRSKSTLLPLGYDLDEWHNYGKKKIVEMDISLSTNSSMVITGMAGCGKSYFMIQIITLLLRKQPNGILYFADYKGDDSFKFLQGLPRYYSYNRTLEALERVYEHLNQRLSGEDITRNSITLVIDEYVAFILALLSKDKKKAQEAMNMVSEILMMGRSMGIRLIVSCQRADSAVFTMGSRLNFGIIIILGAFNKTAYEMLMPDFVKKIEEKRFGRGEGSLLLQGSELYFIKAPTIENFKSIEAICINALQ